MEFILLLLLYRKVPWSCVFLPLCYGTGTGGSVGGEMLLLFEPFPLLLLLPVSGGTAPSVPFSPEEPGSFGGRFSKGGVGVTGGRIVEAL